MTEAYKTAKKACNISLVEGKSLFQRILKNPLKILLKNPIKKYTEKYTPFHTSLSFVFNQLFATFLLTTPSQNKPSTYSSTSVLLMHSFITLRTAVFVINVHQRAYCCSCLQQSLVLLRLLSLPVWGVSKQETVLSSKLFLFIKNFCHQWLSSPVLAISTK